MSWIQKKLTKAVTIIGQENISKEVDSIGSVFFNLDINLTSIINANQ